MQVVAALVGLVSATPDPVAPPDDLVSPGPWGFAVVAFIGLAVALLIFDMMRRIRRGRYRSEVREELDAEAEAASAEPGHGDDRA